MACSERGLKLFFNRTPNPHGKKDKARSSRFVLFHVHLVEAAAFLAHLCKGPIGKQAVPLQLRSIPLREIP